MLKDEIDDCAIGCLLLLGYCYAIRFVWSKNLQDLQDIEHGSETT